MSLNHLIDPLQEPKLDVYVGDVEADTMLVFGNTEILGGNLDVDGNISALGDEGNIFGNLIATQKYINYENGYEDTSYATNSYVFTSPLNSNGWNSLGDCKTFIEVGASSSTFAPYIEKYHITIDGNIDNNSPSVFEFRSREGFTELLDIKCQVQNADGVGDGVYSSVGSSVLPPDDVLNDFQFRVSPVSNFSTPIVPPVSSNAILTIEIKVLIDPSP
jgi:hypothetical protein